MLKILAVIGCILLCLIVLVLWVIIVPRAVFVEYTENAGVLVKVRIFLFKIKVYPLNLPFGKKDKDKPKKEKTEKSAQPQGDKPNQNKKSFTLGEKLPKGMELVKTVLSAVKGVGRILLKGIAIKDVAFTVPISGKNAYDTQKLYGNVTSAFYTFSIFLQKYVRLNIKKPIFVADFADMYSHSTYFYCKIVASPSIILSAGWYLFKIYKNLDKQNNKPLKEK